MNVPQDVRAAPRAAVEELKSRRLIACSGRAVDRTHKLIQGSCALMAEERKLLAQWHARRPGVRSLLARTRRSARGRESSPTPARSFELPNAA